MAISTVQVRTVGGAYVALLTRPSMSKEEVNRRVGFGEYKEQKLEASKPAGN